MKIRPSIPKWTLREAVLAFEILSSVIERNESEPTGTPDLLPERVTTWLQSEPSITYDRERKAISIDPKNYSLPRIVLDAINQIEVLDDPERASDALSIPEEARALFLPFLAATDAYHTKDVVNKLVENAHIFEKTRHVYIPPFVALMLAFRDALSSQGLYSRDEVDSILSEDYPASLDRYLEPLTQTQRKIFRKLLARGILSVDRLTGLNGVSPGDVSNSISEMAQSLGLPVAIYESDSRILTFKTPLIRAWQFDDEVVFKLHPDFADTQGLSPSISTAEILDLAPDHPKSYLEEIETNIVRIDCSELNLANSLTNYYLPIEKPVNAGEVYWGLRKIPNFIELLPKIAKGEFLSGMAKFCLRNLRDRFLGAGCISFPCTSKETALDLYKILHNDFHVLCKRPRPSFLEIYSEGLLEFARVVRLEDVERRLLLSCLDEGHNRITTIRSRTDVETLIEELLLSGPKTAREIGDELLLDDSVLDSILQHMSDRNAVVLDPGGEYRFGFDGGDLYQFINDDQIHRAMRTTL